jgi:hypothetical protein
MRLARHPAERMSQEMLLQLGCVELASPSGAIPRWRTSQTLSQLFKALVNACRTPLEVTINPALTTLTNPDK